MTEKKVGRPNNYISGSIIYSKRVPKKDADYYKNEIDKLVKKLAIDKKQIDK